ncbi:MAG TPA: zf-HC2 domain-containing protein [Puia sp.]|nr:zf-HC2 domain-containing protein [Puia sp.]
MNCKDIQVRLIDYLDQKLDAVTAAEIGLHLETCAVCSREAEEMQELLTAMQDSAMETPPPALRENFNMLLQSELNMQATTHLIEEFPVTPDGGMAAEASGMAAETQRMTAETGASAAKARGTSPKAIRFSSPVWRIAAAVILVAAGIGIGMNLRRRSTEPTTADQLVALRQEVREMKEQVMFNLINDESASQRIKAVGYAEEMASPDQQVIDALVNTLNHDKSVNVRLASLYSLARFADRRAVRDSLVASLKIQTEPIIQVVLINLLAEKRERKAVAPIQDIMTNKKTLKEVRDAAQRSLKIL